MIYADKNATKLHRSCQTPSLRLPYDYTRLPRACTFPPGPYTDPDGLICVISSTFLTADQTVDRLEFRKFPRNYTTFQTILRNFHGTTPLSGSQQPGISTELHRRTVVLLFHEAVADHMQHHEVTVLDSSHVWVRDMKIQLSQWSQLAAIPPAQRNGLAADRVRVFHGPKNVRRVS